MTLSLHQAAREWALKGFAVFPCGAGSKKPGIEGGNGLKDATTDIAQIDRWWTSNPSYNIGCAPDTSGQLSVLDVDPPRGESTLADLELEHELLPATFTVRTPRGGRHIWFKGQLPSSVGTETSGLGPKLDTRGIGGYVLLPPSSVDGVEYESENENEIAPLPSWITPGLKIHEPQRAPCATEGVIDAPEQVGRASRLLADYCAASDVAVEGRGGDNRTFQVACEVLNLGVSPPRAYELIRDIWNPHCIPPWDLDDLAQKVANASEYAQNEEGCWAVDVATVYAPFLSVYSADPKTLQSRFYPRDETEQDKRPEPRWLMEGLLPAASTVMLYGPSGSYKSFLALDMALTLASGIAAWGAPARAACDVVYVPAEGARSVERLRRPAWKMARQVEGPLPFYSIDTMPLVARPAEVVELVEAIKQRGLNPGLIVLDTLSRALAGMNENDAKDAGIFIEAIEMLKRAFDCTVLVVHHSGKEAARGARGSSALFAGFDAVFEVKAKKETKTVTVYERKQKDADEREAPLAFAGRVVGPSLVFFELAPGELKALQVADDAMHPAKVGAALRSLGAIGQERAVSTQVLASHMTPHIVDDTVESHQRAVTVCGRMLHKASHERLAGYVIQRNATIAWCLPVPDSQPS